MNKLIIVESPAKARTIKNFLDSSYQVIASKGHIRDLQKWGLGIKIEEGSFTPTYKISESHLDIVEHIKELSSKADQILIATDEDREGEAIGFHIAEAIGKDARTLPRIVFHEITKSAILAALKSPRHIDMDKVNAQQARRFLDRIVGFKLSSLVSSKIASRMSAGRVQSAALKIIVDREREINIFKPIDFYTISAIFEGVEAHLVKYEGKAIKDQSLRDKNTVDKMIEALRNDTFIVGDLQKKSKKVSPPPPFMTSTLQQSASSTLSFSPKRTMMIAQKLYEGVNTPKGHMGLITYMRTDSLNISKEAQNAARELVKKTLGEEYLPASPRKYATKSKSAQEAHEAIRPTDVSITPKEVQSFLAKDEAALYELIYGRFLASQMSDAIFELHNLTFSGSKGEFKANGRKLIFDGFYALNQSADKDKLIKDLKKDQVLESEQISATKHTTTPPPRFSEASLIKSLESLGIGRPSTYAPTVALLAERNYIQLEKRQIIPQESAFKLTEFLELHFFEIVDSKFSASLEEKLDDIASKKVNWQKMLWEFYVPFIEKVNSGKSQITTQKVLKPTGESCPLCGSDLVVRSGRYGEFVGCSNYPKCKHIKKEPSTSHGECEVCGSEMVEKIGKRGKFIACSGYPKCKNTKPLPGAYTPKDTGVRCPKCNGAIVQRSSKRGVFFGCGNYPKCDFISRFLPNEVKCPQCNFAMTQRTLRGKEVLQCLSKECGHKMDAAQ